MERFVLLTDKERKALELQAIGGGKNTCFPWKWAVGKKTVIDKSIFFVRGYALEKVSA